MPYGPNLGALAGLAICRPAERRSQRLFRPFRSYGTLQFTGLDAQGQSQACIAPLYSDKLRRTPYDRCGDMAGERGVAAGAEKVACGPHNSV